MREMQQTATEALSVVSVDFQLSPGSPLPYGSTVQRGGVNFAVVSESAPSARPWSCSYPRGRAHNGVST